MGRALDHGIKFVPKGIELFRKPKKINNEKEEKHAETENSQLRGKKCNTVFK